MKKQIIIDFELLSVNEVNYIYTVTHNEKPKTIGLTDKVNFSGTLIL